MFNLDNSDRLKVVNLVFVYSFLCSYQSIQCNDAETNQFTHKYLDEVPVKNYRPTSKPLQDGNRKGKDLVYEAMKMRTGVWPPQGKNLDKVVGGGLLEKQLLNSPIFSQARENPDVAIRFESRGQYWYYDIRDHFCESYYNSNIIKQRPFPIYFLIF